MYRSNCKNCGAPLKHYLRECEYCGTENPNFDLLNTNYLYADNVIVESCSKYPVTLQTVKCLGVEDFESCTKDAINWLMHAITNDIAKEIINYVNVEREYDPRTRNYIFRAKLKVIDGK